MRIAIVEIFILFCVLYDLLEQRDRLVCLVLLYF